MAAAHYCVGPTPFRLASGPLPLKGGRGLRFIISLRKSKPGVGVCFKQHEFIFRRENERIPFNRGVGEGGKPFISLSTF